MTTLSEMRNETAEPLELLERRTARRHDLETRSVLVERFDGKHGHQLGRLIDLSSGGMRVRIPTDDVRAEQQIRLRIQLPTYAGISPFIDTTGGGARPSTQWIGWMAVTRLERADDGQYDLAGRIIGMDELDRGMLALYLSTQPLTA